MKDKWFRLLLSLAVIFALLGIMCGLSIAQQPDKVVDAQAYNNCLQAGLIARNQIQVNRCLNPATYTAKSYTNGDVEDRVNAVADALKGAQNDDGGWAIDFIKGNTPLANLYGITGMGLLMAYEMTASMESGNITHDPTSQGYLNAAMAAGDYLADLVDQDPDGNVLLSTDIVFLFGLDKIIATAEGITPDFDYYQAGLTGVKSFCYDPNFNTAADVYAFYNLDPDLKSVKHWNLASWVEAAKLYEAEDPNLGTWADSIMALICDDQDAIGGFVYNKNEAATGHVRTLGQAKVVEVLKRFYADDPDRAQDLEKGLSYLLGLQSDAKGGTSVSGRFCWGGETVGSQLIPWNYETLQDQCYGIQAMAYNFQTTGDNYGKHKGTYWGAGYLIQSRWSEDRFVDTHGVTRIRVDRNSEAIQALYYSCKEGDVDKSGKVASYDALRTLKAGFGVVNLSGPALVAAQWNGSDVSAADASDILMIAVGKNGSKNVCSFLGM